ncbi:CehA/McbA family metallohydrolase [Halorubrum halodurans]|uniref:Histidinol-phosphatase n=1 Tax=Halorubrum halodurans TaxID=1383851 RepID=A0A256IDX8_9EURY|nr:PHP domain-containing protein [Halorubrum halodurans]OYR54526.1 histidinol-phosphatase [Halorubrum halodurans]
MSSVTVRIDPHVHSEDSYDGHEPVELILEHAADIGLDAVVITDHDTMGESKRAAELAPEYGLVGIPGVEVSTADGHLLAIGVDRMPPRGESYAATVSWIHDRGGVAVVPHPFQRSRHGVRRRNIPLPRSDADEGDRSDGAGEVDEVDAIEVFNAWLFTGYRNRRARRFAALHGYPGVAASDAHHLNYVGRAFTELTVRGRSSVDAVTAEDVLAAIREGTTSASGKRAPVPMAARHYLIAAGRKSGYYARTGAVRGATAAARAAVEAVSMTRVGLSQGVHRFGRALSWFR